MSTHLLIAAAYLEGLSQGRKLVLMAFADSGDEHTLASAPGLPKLRAWSGLSRSATQAAVAQLAKPVDKGGDGLLVQVSRGRIGHRAVYRVFPNGVPAIPHPSEVAARYADDDAQPVDNSAEEGPASRTLESALGSCSPPSRVLPAGPLQSFPSVSRVSTVAEPVETRRSASPFPGSRASNAATAEEARAIARRARGAHDHDCPRHPGTVVPCGKCAHDAADADTRAAAAKRARALIAATTAPVAPATDTTEEPTP